MKTFLTLTALFSLTVILAVGQTSTTTPTNDNEIQMRVFGLGIKTFNLLNDASLNTDVLPGNRIIATINASKHFRIQPEFGFSKQTEFNSNVNTDLTNKNSLIGTAIYGMMQKGKTNLYGGIKYLHTNVTMDNVESQFNPNPPYNTTYTVSESNIKYNTWGIVIGGEYFFGNHFSVGVETGFQNTKAKMEDNSSNETDGPTTSSTETNLLIRFYF